MGCSRPHHGEQRWEGQPGTIWALPLLQQTPGWEQPAWAPRDAALPSAVGTAREAPLCLGTGWQLTGEKSLCPEPSGCVGAVGELGRCPRLQAAMAEEPVAWCCLHNPAVIAGGAGAAAASSLTVPS